MTWQNALFDITVVALMGLLEWGRHRLEARLSERRSRRARQG